LGSRLNFCHPTSLPDHVGFLAGAWQIREILPPFCLISSDPSEALKGVFYQVFNSSRITVLVWIWGVPRPNSHTYLWGLY
jgi:hypothetical protein